MSSNENLLPPLSGKETGGMLSVPDSGCESDSHGFPSGQYNSALEVVLNAARAANPRVDIGSTMLARVCQDEKVVNVLRDAFVEDTLAPIRAMKRKTKRIKVKQALSIIEINELAKEFEQYAVVCEDAEPSFSTHKYAAAQRACAVRMMTDLLGVVDEMVTSPPYQCLIKDVGGNPIKQITNLCFTTHVCCPQLSLFDATRYSEYRLFIDNSVGSVRYRDEPLFRKMIDLHVRCESDRAASEIIMCRRRSEDCNIRAKYLMYVHSCYDITPKQLAKQMFVAGADKAMGIFHFDPNVLLYDEGEHPLTNLKWEKCKHEDGRLMIKFTFGKNDTQQSYVHEYKNYIKYASAFVLTHEDKKTGPHHYSYRLVYNKNFLAMFEVHRLHGFVPTSYNMRQFYSGDNSKVIIYTWKYDTIGEGMTGIDHMKKIRIVCDRAMWDNLCNYALTMSAGKFTLETLMSAAVSFNSKEFVNGMALKVKDKLDNSSLVSVVVACYAMTYVLKYEYSAAWKLMKDNEGRVRDSYRSNVFKRLFNRVADIQWFVGICKLIKCFENEEDIPICPSDQVPISFLPIIKKSIFHIFKLFSIAKYKRHYPVHAADALTVLTFAEENNILYTEEEPSIAHFSYNEATKMALATRASLRESLLAVMTQDLATVKGVADRVPMPTLASCHREVEVIPNDGEGNCLYYALIDSGSLNETVGTLKARLLNSNFLSCMKEQEHIKKQLAMDKPTREYWGDDNILELFAMEYCCTVCVHTENECMRYGSATKIIHVSLRAEHYEGLEECLPSILAFGSWESDQNDLVSVPDIGDDYAYEPAFLRNSDRKPCCIVLKAMHKFSKFGSGYLDPVGLPVAEVLERCRLSGSSSLVIGCTPGGAAEAALKKFVNVSVVAGKIDANYMVCLTTLPNITYLNTIDDSDYFVDGLIENAANQSITYDNLIVSMDHKLDAFGRSPNCYSVRSLIALVQVVNVGGSMVIRLSRVSVEELVNLYEISLYFKEVKFVRPFTSSPLVPDVYVSFVDRVDAEFEANAGSIVVSNNFLSVWKSFIAIVKEDAGNQKLKFDEKLIEKMKDGYIEDEVLPARALECYSRLRTTPLDSRGGARNITDYSRNYRFRRLIPYGTINYIANSLKLKRLITERKIYYKPKKVFEPHVHIDKAEEIKEECGTAEATEGADLTTTVVNTTELAPVQRSKLRRIVHSFNKKSRKAGRKFKAVVYDDVIPFYKSRSTPGYQVERCDLHTLKIEEIPPLAGKTPLIYTTKTETTGETNTMSEEEKSHTKMMDVINDFKGYTQKNIEVIKGNSVSTLNMYESTPNLVTDVVGRLPKGYAIYNTTLKRIISADKVEFDINRSHCYYKGEIQPMSVVIGIKDANLVLCTEMDIFLDYKYLETIGSIQKIKMPKDVGLVQAPPGCGKTYNLIQKAKTLGSSVLFLCSTREGKDDVAKRAASEDLKDLEVRTIHSYLSRPDVKVDNLLIDEAFMQHPGMIVCAIVKSEAKFVRMVGDVLQIPFVPRVREYEVKYKRLDALFDIVETYYLSYRCPRDVCALFDPDYKAVNRGILDKGFKTTSTVGQSLKVVKISSVSSVPLTPGTTYLTMKQSEKQALRGLYPNIVVSTVHEYQGKQSKNIALVRLSQIPGETIYLDTAYVLVAMTRHTHTFVYYTICDKDIISANCRQQFSQQELLAVYSAAGGSLQHGFREKSSYAMGTVSSRGDSIKLVPIRTDKYNFKSVNGTLYVSRDYLRRSNVDTVLKSVRKLVGRKPVRVDNSIFCYFEHQHLMNKAYVLGMVVCSDTLTDDVLPYQIFDFMNINSYVDDLRMRDEQFDPTAVIHGMPLEHEFLADAPVGTIDDVKTMLDVIQPWVFPTDDSEHWFMLSTCDLDVNLDHVSYPVTRSVGKRKIYDNLTPVLRTTMPRVRNAELRESLLALVKRNKNVPELSSCVDYDGLSTKMVDNFVVSFLKRSEPFPTFGISSSEIADWLKGQEFNNYDLIVPDRSLTQTDLGSYQFSIKKTPKPILTYDAELQYQALQTIVCQGKDVNTLFCPLFRVIKERLLTHLKEKFLIYTGMSNTEFENILTDRFLGDLVSERMKVEVDISKYDKSQGLLALMFECKLMRFFGVEEEYINLWYTSHVFSKLTDFSSGLKTTVVYQRKSGDASTFIGNTMFLMAVLSMIYDMDSIDMGLFAGDDSLLVGDSASKKVDSLEIGNLFNIECKVFYYRSSYFCSKFLVNTGNRIYVMPDVVKMSIKLGNKSLVNYEHMEEFRVSFCDLVSNYSSKFLCDLCSSALEERYNLCFDFSLATSALHHIVTNKDEFAKMYYAADGANICTDPSRPRFD